MQWLLKIPLGIPRAMQGYQLMRVGAAVLTGVLLAKTALLTEEIGAWESLLFIGSVVVFTGVNGLLQGMSPVYARLDEAGKRHFLGEVFVVFVAIGLAVFGLLLCLEPWVVPFLTGLPQIPGFGWFALYLLLQIPSLPTEMYYMLWGKPWQLLGWGALGFGCQIAVVFFPAWMGWGLESSLKGLCVLAAFRLGWTLYLLWRRTNWDWDWERLEGYLRLSAPLAAVSFTGNLIVFFDNWLVGQWFSDAATFAIYRYGSREFPLALALAGALSTAMVPRIAAYGAEGMAELRRRSARLMHVVMPLSVVLGATVSRWFPWVFSEDLAAAGALFRIYLLVTLSRVLLPNAVLVALGDTRVIFRVGLGELGLKVVLGAVFIYFWGLEGVAWSVVLSFWFEKLALAYRLWDRHGIRPNQWLPLPIYIFYALLLLSTFLLTLTP